MIDSFFSSFPSEMSPPSLQYIELFYYYYIIISFFVVFVPFPSTFCFCCSFFLSHLIFVFILTAATNNKKITKY